MYDFEKSCARHVQPADRMGFHVPFKYTEWQPEDPARADKLFCDLLDMYEQGKDLETSNEG
eukprot:13094994-Alexandrium_andersonii.AAC.1